MMTALALLLVILVAIILLYALYRGHSVKLSFRVPGAALSLEARDKHQR